MSCVSEDKYMKTILHTDKINDNEFIITPYTHWSGQLMENL